MNFEKNKFVVNIDCDNKKMTNYLRDFDYLKRINNKDYTKDTTFMNMVRINKPADWNHSSFKYVFGKSF